MADKTKKLAKQLNYQMKIHTAAQNTLHVYNKTIWYFNDNKMCFEEDHGLKIEPPMN